MGRKRSRANTEECFQKAVRRLVSESGFAQFGVNLIAQTAGADKVLIYRYFGDLNGLLESVANSRLWLPRVDDLLSAVSGEPKDILFKLESIIIEHVRIDSPTCQVCRWRHAVTNPLTEKYNSDWKQLWQELPKRLDTGLDLDGRKRWSRACSMLSLIVDAKLRDEPVPGDYLDLLAQHLEAPGLKIRDSKASETTADILPTNLL